jgi:hypothetical protein
MGRDRLVIEPWQDLLARAERELALAAEGRWEELAEASDERARVAMTLPPPSPVARPLLERLAAVQDELTAAIVAARAETARELASLSHGRGAVRGYASSPAGAGGWVDETH